MKFSGFLAAAGLALCVAGLSAPASATVYNITLANGVTTEPVVRYTLANSSTTNTKTFTNEYDFTLAANFTYDLTVTDTFLKGLLGGSLNNTEEVKISGPSSFSYDSGAVGASKSPITAEFGSLSAGSYSVVVTDTLPKATALFGLVPSSGGYTLSFNLASTEITQTPAVPEASTWAMLVLGFAGVGFMAYRRKQGGASFRLA